MAKKRVQSLHATNIDNLAVLKDWCIVVAAKIKSSYSFNIRKYSFSIGLGD